MKTTIGSDVSTRELADLLSLSDRRIRQLAEAGILPTPTAGRFPLRAAVAQYIAHLRAKKDSKTLLSVRTRRTEAQARLCECEADLAEAKVIPAETVFRYCSGIFAGFKARVLSSSLEPIEQTEILTDLMRLTTKEIFSYDQTQNTKPAADFTPAAKPQPPNLGEQNR